MSQLVEYIIQNYKQIQILQDNAYGLTEIVHGADGGIYVRKTLHNVNEPVKALKGLKHKNLVAVLQVATDTSHTYILEEYLDGKSLQTLINEKGPLAEQQVVDIAEQICDGLYFLHKQGIIHRDIKPSNIILQSSGVAKLLDYGAVRIVSDTANHDTHILGTEGFAPPEQYGFGSTDERSDIYALGKTIQVLLGDNYNGYLNNVIKKCTSFAPDDRPRDVMEVKGLLKRSTLKINSVLIGIVCLVLAGGCWATLSSPKDNGNNKQLTTIDSKAENLPSAKENVVNQEPIQKKPEVPSPVKKQEATAVETPKKAESIEPIAKPSQSAINSNTEVKKPVDNPNYKSYWETLNLVTASISIVNTEMQIDKSASSKSHVILKPVSKPVSIVVTNTSDYDLESFNIHIGLGGLGIEAGNYSSAIGNFFVHYEYFAAGTVNTVLNIRVSGNLKAHQKLIIPIEGNIKWHRLGPKPVIYAQIRPKELYKTLDNKASEINVQ